MVVRWIDCAKYVIFVFCLPTTYSLFVAVMTGLVGIIIPFSKTMDLIYAIGGCLLFSGYIVYDTFLINAKLSPDEFIMGAISLYLEYVLYLVSIFRILTVSCFA